MEIKDSHIEVLPNQDHWTRTDSYGLPVMTVLTSGTNEPSFLTHHKSKLCLLSFSQNLTILSMECRQKLVISFRFAATVHFIFKIYFAFFFPPQKFGTTHKHTRSTCFSTVIIKARFSFSIRLEKRKEGSVLIRGKPPNRWRSSPGLFRNDTNVQQTADGSFCRLSSLAIYNWNTNYNI